MTSALAAIASFVLPSVVHAQNLPPVLCGNIPGCGLPPGNVPLEVLGVTAQFMVNLTAGLSVLFVIIAGVQMVISSGEETKVGKARWGIASAVGGLALAMVSQTLVAFIVTEEYGQNSNSPNFILSDLLPNAVRIILTLFNVTFLIMIMVQGFRIYIGSGKTDTYNSALSAIRWAIVGAIIVNAARAIVQALFTLNL